MEIEIDLEKKIKELDNILFKVGQSAQTMNMLTKPQAFYDNIHKQALGYQNPFHLKKAQRNKPTLYDPEQAFWLRMSDPTIKPFDALLVKIEAPKELPKLSLVNKSLKKLKIHLAKFDNVVKIRTTPNARTEENEDLKAQIQDKVFVITSLKNDLRKLKGKEIVDIAAQTPSAHTVVLGMFKLDLEPLAPRMLHQLVFHHHKNNNTLPSFLKVLTKIPLFHDDPLNESCAVTTSMTVILKQFQATPPPAFIKFVEEICVTCGGAHPYYQCLAADDNTFLEFWDNIQGYFSAAAVNYNQGNSGYHPSSEDERVEETFMDPELDEYTIKEKLLELANTPFNENCSAVILKKLPEKLGYPGKFLIPCGFNELKCTALADLGASINLMPLSIWKNLERSSSPPHLRKTFFTIARALIDVHGEEMIFRDDDERLTLNMKHDTSSYSNQPQKESINMINIYDDSYEDYFEYLFATNHLICNLTFSSHTDLTLPKVINPLSGNRTFSSSSSDHLLEEFADEPTLITFPPRNDDLPFDIESDLREIKYLLNHDPIKEMDFILEDSINKCNLADPNDDLVDTIPEMFTDEHTLDYLSPPLYDDVNDDLNELESDNDDVYNDPFDYKEDKIKVSKLLIDELDPPRSSDFLHSLEYDSFLYEDFFEVDALPSTDNEDKVFNLGTIIHENLSEVIVQVAPDKNVKKISISNASLILEDFNPPLYELLFYKEVLGSKTLLSFSFENEEKVFYPGILTFKGVHTSLLPKLSYRGLKAFKVIKIFESPMEIFPCSYGDDIRILDVSCLHLYPQ
nr:reverse transcriptase domain-containing protein [Tanacetum cinerariifolium]